MHVAAHALPCLQVTSHDLAGEQARASRDQLAFCVVHMSRSSQMTGHPSSQMTGCLKYLIRTVLPLSHLHSLFHVGRTTLQLRMSGEERPGKSCALRVPGSGQSPTLTCLCRQSPIASARRTRFGFLLAHLTLAGRTGQITATIGVGNLHAGPRALDWSCMFFVLVGVTATQCQATYL